MEPWCSLVNTLPCQGRDREFESRRLRILVFDFQHISPLGIPPDGDFFMHHFQHENFGKFLRIVVNLLFLC